MDKIKVTLYEPAQAHKALAEAWVCIKPMVMAGHRLTLEVRKKTRSIEQNSRLWAMLAEVSAQVDWYGQKLSPEEWKDLLTASQKRQRAVPGIDGGFVVLGARTSHMTVAEMCELQTLIEAFGADKGVIFSDSERSTQ